MLQNFRDIGGYTGHLGKQVRTGRIYRGAAPTELSPQEITANLRPYQLRQVIDLRSVAELRKFGELRIPGEVLHRPLIAESQVEQTFPSLFDAYASFLSHPGAAGRLAEVLTIVARAPAAILICCSAGKDRTGIVVAALLDLLDVPSQSIVEDYAASSAHLEQLYARWAENPSSSIMERLSTDAHMLGAPAQAMSRLLDWIGKEYGGFGRYLTSHGSSKDLVQTLRRHLLSERRS